jgi:hypothetical protein
LVGMCTCRCSATSGTRGPSSWAMCSGINAAIAQTADAARLLNS